MPRPSGPSVLYIKSMLRTKVGKRYSDAPLAARASARRTSSPGVVSTRASVRWGRNGRLPPERRARRTPVRYRDVGVRVAAPPPLHPYDARRRKFGNAPNSPSDAPEHRVAGRHGVERRRQTRHQIVGLLAQETSASDAAGNIHPRQRPGRLAQRNRRRADCRACRKLELVATNSRTGHRQRMRGGLGRAHVTPASTFSDPDRYPRGSISA